MFQFEMPNHQSDSSSSRLTKTTHDLPPSTNTTYIGSHIKSHFGTVVRRNDPRRHSTLAYNNNLNNNNNTALNNSSSDHDLPTKYQTIGRSNTLATSSWNLPINNAPLLLERHQRRSSSQADLNPIVARGSTSLDGLTPSTISLYKNQFMNCVQSNRLNGNSPDSDYKAETVDELYELALLCVRISHQSPALFIYFYLNLHFTFPYIHL
jgi:hypothetical protein